MLGNFLEDYNFSSSHEQMFINHHITTWNHDTLTDELMEVSYMLHIVLSTQEYLY